MEAVNKRRIANNAYRVLGLPANATQADVERASRRMRIWPDPSRIPPTPWDIPALGAVPRARNDIEQALARLAEPASRVLERQMWFSLTCSAFRSTATDTFAAAAVELKEAPTSPAAEHDMALASLLAVLDAPPEAAVLDAWREIVRLFTQVAVSAEYFTWIQETETNGDFEKRASEDEIRSSLALLPQAAVEMLADLATHQLTDQSLCACIRAASVMRACANVAPVVNAVADRLLDRVEDSFTAQCNRLTQELRTEVRQTGPQDASFHSHNRNLCHRVNREFVDNLAPVLLKLAEVSSEDRMLRARSVAAETLWILGECLFLADQLDESESTLYKALEQAKGTRLAGTLNTAIERVRRTRYSRPSFVYRPYNPPSPRPVTGGKMGGTPLPPPPPVGTSSPRPAASQHVNVRRRAVRGPIKKAGVFSWPRGATVGFAFLIIALIRMAISTSPTSPPAPDFQAWSRRQLPMVAPVMSNPNPNPSQNRGWPLDTSGNGNRGFGVPLPVDALPLSSGPWVNGKSRLDSRLGQQSTEKFLQEIDLRDFNGGPSSQDIRRPKPDVSPAPGSPPNQPFQADGLTLSPSLPRPSNAPGGRK